MSHISLAKSYNIFAKFNNGEDMKEFVVRTDLSEVPPLMTGLDHSVAMYLEGYRIGVESITGIEIEFEYEEIK